MTYTDIDPTVVHTTDEDTTESEAFTHEQMAEIEEVYRASFLTLVKRAESFKIRDPEATTNTAFIKAINNWDKYEDKGYSRETWISRILANAALDELRKTKRRGVDVPLEAVEYAIQLDSYESPDIDSLLDDLESANILQQVKDLLITKNKPDSWYDIFVQRVQGYGYDEIATNLDMSSGTVRSGLHRVTKLLAENEDIRALLGKV